MFRNYLPRALRGQSPGNRGRRRSPFRPALFDLEDRVVPTTYLVSNVNDAGTGTLRQAISDSDGSTVTISGATLSGFHSYGPGGLAAISSSVNWGFNACVITGCTAGGYGGGVFYVSGVGSPHLNFGNSTISGNTAAAG